MIHTNFYRKAIMRRPIRSLLLLLLLVAITGAFSSHLAEYLLVVQEMNYVEEYYKPIGKLVSSEWDIEAGQAIVAECPYVELEDIRRFCPGTLDGIQNANVDAGKDRIGLSGYASDVVFTGILKKKAYVEVQEGGYYELTFEVDGVEAGYKDYIEKNEIIHVRSLPGLADASAFESSVYYPQEQDEAFLAEYQNLVEENRYLLRAYYTEMNGINSIFAARNGNAGTNFVLDTLLPEEDSIYFYELESGKKIDETDAQLDGLSSYIDVLKHNQRVVEVVGTKDMSRIPLCQNQEKRYYLTEGRWLNREDDIDGNRVCVVHDFLARHRGLKIGDKIRINLENREMPFWEKGENTVDYESKMEEFEIVGFYEDRLTVNDFITYYSQMLYVPDSCIPREFKLHNMLVSGGDNFYSFVLKKPEDRQRFLEEYKDRMETLQIQIQFVENNAENFAITTRGLKTSTLYSTLIFGGLLCMVEIFICLIYLTQHRREFAIARILGISGRCAVTGLLRSFLWIAVPGTVLGSALGWQHTVRMADQILMPLELADELKHEIILPWKWLIILMALILLLGGLLLLFGSSYIAQKPVLVVLQEQHGKKKITKRTKNFEQKTEKYEMPVKQQEQEGAKVSSHMGNEQELRGNRRNALKASLNYMGRHQIRAVKTTIIAVCLGVGTAVVFGWLCEMIQKNTLEIERIYTTTVIEGEIVKASSGTVSGETGGGIIPPSAVLKMQETGLVKDVYLEETIEVTGVFAQTGWPENKPKNEVVLEKASLLGISDWDGFLKNTGAGISVQFYPGWIPERFMVERELGDQRYLDVILSEKMQRELGAELGDSVFMQKGKTYLIALVGGIYQGTLGNGMDDAILVHTKTLHEFTDTNYYNLLARFTFMPEKNRELIERETELMQMVEEYPNPVPLRLLIWDEELHQAVEPIERTLQLLEILYPIALVLFFVIGIGFQFLILQQRGSEAAVMRTLGNKTGTVRWIFMAEQMWLCLSGLIIGILFVAALSWQETGKMWFGIGMYLLGNAAGILLGSYTITKKNPLALLQEKE